MDPNAGNPFMEGGNPYMQPGQTPVSGGDMPGGPSAVPMGGGGSSETTKPRQMPGGTDPMGGGAPDMPLAPGGAGAPPPMASGGDSNVPQPNASARSAVLDPNIYRQRVQTIRREVMASNPEVNTREAQVIALAVLALQTEGANGVPTVTDWQQRRQQRQQQKTKNQSQRAGQWGDLNDPNHPYWQQNGGHPFYNVGRMGPAGPYGGRNRLEEHALSRGYAGNGAEWWAVGDKVLNSVVDGVRDHVDRRRQRKAPPANSPGGRQLP